MKIARLGFSSAVFLVLVGLASCGGSDEGSAPVSIGAVVSGLAGTGLVLADNGTDHLGVSSNGSFTFATKVPADGAYEVTVLSQPVSPTQTCLVANGSGHAEAEQAVNVQVTCTTNRYTVGGTVSGLVGSGLVLQNNAGDNLTVTGGGSFTFVTPVASGASYGVSVLTQPSDPVQVCRVSSAGAGVVTSSNVSSIGVTCATSILRLLAGNLGGPGSADGIGAAARFEYPTAVAADTHGNIYVADYANFTVRKITSAGVVTTFAGQVGVQGSDDGIGTAATFNDPRGIATDAAGNVYVADTFVGQNDATGNDTIRKITPAGVVTTLAGKAGMSGNADGIGAAARFDYPTGAATDAAGNVYVTDTYNYTIRKITPAGVVTTLAGMAGAGGNADGVGAAARFNGAQGIAADAAGNVYVADTFNDTIRKITPAGAVTTLAGQAGVAGSADGTGSSARFNQPSGIAVDTVGNLYVADTSNDTIRKITPTGMVTTLAGMAGAGGSTDGIGAAARFSLPQGVTVDPAGHVYVADTGNATVREVTASGAVTTFAGDAAVQGDADGIGAAASFGFTGGLAVDATGDIDVVDSFNNSIRKVTPAGAVTTLATTGVSLLYPNGVAIDGNGDIYVADSGFHDNPNQVIKITAAGVATAFAGQSGTCGSADGVGTAAQFCDFGGIATDAIGNIYVSDLYNKTIRKITPEGVVTTLAGKAGMSGDTDGTGAEARFNSPGALATNAAGDIYVADSGNNNVRKITPAGVVTTLDVQFSAVTGIAIDAVGNVYAGDGSTIRKITPAGQVSTVVGVQNQSTFQPGTLPGLIPNLSGLAISGTSLYFTSEQGVGVVENVP
jgi:sugar lactone lactonase YvrE